MGGHLSTTPDGDNEEIFGRALDISETSAEFKFLDKFLGIHSSFVNDYQTEFRKRVHLARNGRIKWDFWTSRSTYESAFLKIMNKIDEMVKGTTTRELCHLASHVVECRRFELNGRLGLAFNAHLYVYIKWKEIELRLVQKQLGAPTTYSIADSKTAHLLGPGAPIGTAMGVVGLLANFGRGRNTLAKIHQHQNQNVNVKI